jgi:hypothetical protein
MMPQGLYAKIQNKPPAPPCLGEALRRGILLPLIFFLFLDLERTIDQAHFSRHNKTKNIFPAEFSAFPRPLVQDL